MTGIFTVPEIFLKGPEIFQGAVFWARQARGCFLGKARLFSGQGKERSRGEIVIVLDRDRSCARRSRAHHAREIAPDVATGRART